jgi:hypothetical protein
MTHHPDVTIDTSGTLSSLSHLFTIRSSCLRGQRTTASPPLRHGSPQLLCCLASQATLTTHHHHVGGVSTLRETPNKRSSRQHVSSALVTSRRAKPRQFPPYQVMGPARFRCQAAAPRAQSLRANIAWAGDTLITKANNSRSWSERDVDASVARQERPD